MKNTRLPYGVSDYPPNECYKYEAVSGKIRQSFERFGYLRVDLPSLDNFELFNGITGATDISRMFKLTDNDGGLLVLRPDPTLQVCRMAAKIKTPIQKYYYTVKSYEYLPSADTERQREFHQAGIELIGKSGEAGDIEVIKVAIESLLATGLKDFLIEIGHVDFLYGILQGVGLAPADIDTLRQLIDIKDTLGIEMLLSKCGVSAKDVANIRSITGLFGGEEVFDRAEQLAVNNAISKTAVNNIRTVYNALKSAGFGKYISVDFGIVKKRDYYSGIVFRGFCRSLGTAPLLSGGRYDKLMQNFGQAVPATGMAIGVRHLMSALGNVKCTVPVPQIAYITLKANAAKEYEFVSGLKAKGKRVSKLFFETEAELVRYCQEKGIKEWHII